MNQNKTVMLWTLCPENTPGSRKVNAAPNGIQWICPKPYTAKQADAFRYENEQGDPYNGYIVSLAVFAKDENGQIDFEDAEWTNEHFFALEDYVISEEGRLTGFLAAENAVLWIDFFEKGGALYDTFGIPLREFTEEFIDWDPDTDEEIEFDKTLVEYGYLTHSRW